jgi:hypothetical protein
VEEGLPKTAVQVTYWDGKLRAEYNSETLAEYRCGWDRTNNCPKSITQPKYYENRYERQQQVLFNPLWVRDPIEMELPAKEMKKQAVGGKQLRLYLGPELVR